MLTEMVASITYSSDSIEPPHTPPKRERKKNSQKCTKSEAKRRHLSSIFYPIFYQSK